MSHGTPAHTGRWRPQQSGSQWGTSLYNTPLLGRGRRERRRMKGRRFKGGKGGRMMKGGEGEGGKEEDERERGRKEKDSKVGEMKGHG